MGRSPRLGTNPEDEASLSHSEKVGLLFSKHNTSLVSYLKKRLRSSHDAKDVAQQAYVRLLTAKNPRGWKDLRAYLYTTAINAAKDWVAQRRRRNEIEGGLLHESEDRRTPEAARAADDEFALLMDALEPLPPACREAFLLRLSGLTPAQVASVMSINRRTVSRYINRALACSMQARAREGESK